MNDKKHLWFRARRENDPLFRPKCFCRFFFVLFVAFCGKSACSIEDVILQNNDNCLMADSSKWERN